MLGRAYYDALSTSWCQKYGNGTHLARNSYLVEVCISNRALILVRVVENDGNASFGDTSLSALVDEVLLVLGAHRGHVCDPEHKTDGI